MQGNAYRARGSKSCGSVARRASQEALGKRLGAGEYARLQGDRGEMPKLRENRPLCF
jgi:hypothetical protein